MIFKQVDDIKAGRKTQTRRVVKETERILYHDDEGCFVVFTGNRVKWWGNGRYAIVPKRGQAGVGHVQFKRIRSEALQSITHEDALAEGVNSIEEYKALWESINKQKGTRWDDNPLVWVIEFEYVGVGHNDIVDCKEEIFFQVETSYNMNHGEQDIEELREFLVSEKGFNKGVVDLTLSVFGNHNTIAFEDLHLMYGDAR